MARLNCVQSDSLAKETAWENGDSGTRLIKHEHVELPITMMIGQLRPKDPCGEIRRIVEDALVVYRVAPAGCCLLAGSWALSPRKSLVCFEVCESKAKHIRHRKEGQSTDYP